MEAEVETGEGAAPGAPDPAEEQPSAPLREEPEGAEEEEEEPNERSRSEPPKSRLKSLRESPILQGHLLYVQGWLVTLKFGSTQSERGR